MISFGGYGAINEGNRARMMKNSRMALPMMLYLFESRRLMALWKLDRFARFLETAVIAVSFLVLYFVFIAIFSLRKS